MGCRTTILRSWWGTLLFIMAWAAVAQPFSNISQISIPVGAGTAPAAGNPPSPGISYSPFPSTINVTGLTGTITKLTVVLNNLSVDRPDDIDLLLVGPTGANLVILSDIGGTTAAVNSVTLTLDDAAANLLPDNGPLVSGRFRPTTVNSGLVKDNFPPPAPALGSYTFAAPFGTATLASQFNGTNPNGTWSLYVVDDALGPPTGSGGLIGGGWTLDITTSATAAPTATVLGSSLNPSFTTPPENAVTFTATVTSAGVAVTEGSVTFLDGNTTLQASSPLNAAGQASLATSSFSEGSHAIRAVYNGTANFSTSNANLSQVVDNHTVINGNAFCNPGAVSIPDGLNSSAATPYPSKVFVSGLSGSVSRVILQLRGLTETRPDDLDLLLVGPNGAKFVPMSDVGGTNSVTGITLTLDDAAASLMPDAGILTTGSFKPTAVNSGPGAIFPAPEPTGPYSFAAPFGSATFTSQFGGANPNGTWSLYAVDDAAGGGTGSLAAGPCLSFVTTNDPPTVTTLTSSPNPSFTLPPGDAVTFTAHVRTAATGVPVTAGTATLLEGSTVLASAVPLDVNGEASFTPAALGEGTHVLTAQYSGSPGSFNLSNGSLTQTVDNHTVVNGQTFCNPGPLNLNGSGTATPYPEHIFVSGLAGQLGKVTVSLRGLSHPRPDDIDLLLVGPTGAQLIALSDVGGTISTSNVTLTLDDTAASLLPDGGPLATGTFRPTNVNPNGLTDTFPAPAPTAPFASPAPAGTASLTSAFAGTDPNGPWSLYLVNDSLGAGGSLAAGACLTFALAPDVSLTKSHVGDFVQGEAGATYTLTVSNVGAVATTGTVTVTDSLPAGLTAVAMGGTGWNCSLAPLSCSRSDVLAQGTAYPPIVLQVDVTPDAAASLTNTAKVAGEGDFNVTNDSASDTAVVLPGGPVSLSALITGKSGPASARLWTLTLSNGGTGAAANARFTGLGLTQTFGPACTPLLTTPLPIEVGVVPAGGTGSVAASLDFSSCTSAARFTVTLSFSANGGAVHGTKSLNNQFR